MQPSDSHARGMLAALVVALAGLIPAASTVTAAPIVANSRITAVTVYTDRAFVTRTASLDLPAAGIAEVTFANLPASLREESLTVAGRGAAPVTILDVTGHHTLPEVTPNERIKALEDELAALKKQRRVLDDRGNILKAQEASVARLEAAATTAPAKDGAPRLSIEESLKLLAFLEEQRTKSAAERLTLDTQLDEIGRKQTALEQTLAEVRGSTGPRYLDLTVRLQAATAGKLELLLSYALPGARWEPQYDVRAAGGERTLQLGYFGVVEQATGEDWKDVALTLSTARPNLGGAAPVLAPWSLDIVQPRPAPGGYDSGGAGRARPDPALTLPGNAAPVADTVQLQPFQVGNAKAIVATGMTSASFKIATPATLPSDLSPQKVPIATLKLPSVPEYLSTPKRIAAAFLTAQVTNDSEFPLLGGDANIFLDGSFVTSSTLPTVMPGEKFAVALGVDEGIGVKHKRLNRFGEETGLTNSGRRVTYDYLITLQNNKRTVERVVVTDQVPVSRHEKVVVKIGAPTEREAKPTKEGELKWTLDLKPGEKRDLALKFSVDYPQDVTVIGLEN